MNLLKRDGSRSKTGDFCAAFEEVIAGVLGVKPSEKPKQKKNKP
jgi:hypothetical protein